VHSSELWRKWELSENRYKWKAIIVLIMISSSDNHINCILFHGWSRILINIWWITRINNAACMKQNLLYYFTLDRSSINVASNMAASSFPKIFTPPPYLKVLSRYSYVHGERVPRRAVSRAYICAVNWANLAIFLS